jgi:anti-anti-sigma regulatory factor
VVSADSDNICLGGQRVSTRRDRSTVVRLSGPMGAAGAARLEHLLFGASMFTTHLVVDMSQVTELGTEALVVLAEAAERLEEPYTLAVVIGNAPAAVLHSIENAGLQRTVRLFDTVVHALGAGSRRSAISARSVGPPIMSRVPRRSVSTHPWTPREASYWRRASMGQSLAARTAG